MYISQVSGERLQDHWSSGSFFFFFKNDILLSFQSRTEDLTHNIRAYVVDWVYMSALYTALKKIYEPQRDKMYLRTF